MDIALHMKTSYQDFFKYYLKQSTVDGDVLAMKRDINSHKYETWADLEIGMGVYASQCADKEVFLKCLADIKANLKGYLQKEYEKIILYQLSSSYNFSNPGLLLDPNPKYRYDKYRAKRNANTIINVITLNYTSTLERLLGFKGSVLAIDPYTQLHTIQHIHGTLNNMMVMGVNDSAQISNANFNTDMDVIEDFVKPEYNDACMNNKNIICETLIEEADIIVLYGSSLGKSDDKWWKLIGKRMQADNYPLLIYLPYDESKNQVAEPNHLRRWTLEYVNEIRERFDIILDEKVLANRMCVALNKRLFQIIKVPQHSIK